MINNITIKLSNLALFSELYNKSNNDIFGVLWDFIADVIYRKNLTVFKVEDIEKSLKEEFHFDSIPTSVINIALKKKKISKYINFHNGEYNITPYFNELMKKSNFEDDYDALYNNELSFFGKLYDFIKEKDSTISKKLLIEELQKYCLDDDINSEWSEMLSLFFSNITSEEAVIINKIKEGFILYNGLCWCDDLNEPLKWKKKLTMYFDMDVIFYLAGYSGEVYNKIVKELLDYVKKTNVAYAKKHKGQKCIQLRYLPDVREQINRYFDVAEDIIRCRYELNPSESAMKYLTTTYTSPSDLKICRQKLEVMLNNYAIIEESVIPDMTDENLAKYNIFDLTEVDSIVKYRKYDKEKVMRYLERINTMSYFRANHCVDTFQTSECFIVTRSSMCAFLDNNPKFERKNQFRRVLSPEVVTSRLWFLLNTGLSKQSAPSSLSIIVRAQTILAGKISDNIKKSYENIKEKYDNGEISKEDLVWCLADLRQYSTLPENASEEVLAETNEISEYDVQQMIKKRENEENKQKENEKIINKIINENSDMKKIINDNVEEIDKVRHENETIKTEYKTLTMENDKKKNELIVKENEINKKNKEIEDLTLQINKISKTVYYVIVVMIMVVALFVCVWIHLTGNMLGMGIVAFLSLIDFILVMCSNLKTRLKKNEV